MPQPISRVATSANISIGNNWDSPSHHRPELALQAMNVIAEWSILENFLTGLFVTMLGANPGPAIAIYSAMTSAAAQRDALRAVASNVMAPDELDVFDAILSQFTSAAKDRNKIAHWIWGFSPKLPDAVLLGDPKALLMFSSGQRSDLPKDDIFVYRENDFKELSRKIQRLMGFTTSFRFVLHRDHPCNQDDEEFLRLLSEPEVHEFLSRLHERRKKSQEDDPPPPETPGSP